MTVPGGKARLFLFYYSMPAVQCIRISRYVCRRAEGESRSKTDGRESWVDEGVRYSNATTRAQGLNPM
jgi:hypothetical protein